MGYLSLRVWDSMGRRLLLIFSCLIVTLGSFSLTLRFIDKTTRSTAKIDVQVARERLASRGVASYSQLPEVASQSGLKFSAQMLGHTDALTRINDKEVLMGGWLADPEGDATPNELMVFISGALAARTQTNGERPDVQQAYNLYFGTEKNVAFQVTFPCRAGDQPVTVALGSGGQYFGLDTPPCP
jgi:hypothetical protein